MEYSLYRRIVILKSYRGVGKIMDKRLLIVVSLCVVVLLVLGSSNTVVANEEMPDLIIEDLVISPGHQPGDEEYWLKLKNIGNASTPSNKGIDITVTVR